MSFALPAQDFPGDYGGCASAGGRGLASTNYFGPERLPERQEPSPSLVCYPVKPAVFRASETILATETDQIQLPLRGRNIVITRARAQAEDFAIELERFGARVIPCPT